MSDVCYTFLSLGKFIFFQHFSDLIHKINYSGNNESSKHSTCNTLPFSFKRQKRLKTIE